MAPEAWPGQGRGRGSAQLSQRGAGGRGGEGGAKSAGPRPAGRPGLEPGGSCCRIHSRSGSRSQPKLPGAGRQALPTGAQRTRHLAPAGARAWALSEAGSPDYWAPPGAGAWIAPARPGHGLNTQESPESGPKRQKNKDSIQA